MLRVLIPSDDRDFVQHLASGYHAAGAEVVTGAYNFELRGAPYDIVHHQWPEEFCRWGIPSEAQLNRIESTLRWWAERTTNVLSVNNLLPHRHEDDEQARALYNLFYRHCSVIMHYSRESMRLVQEEFPMSRKCLHVVTTPFNYELLLPLQSGVGSRRCELGLREHDFVILVFGSLRRWDEIRLIRDAYAKARIPHKRLLVSGRFAEAGPRLQQQWRRVRWFAWLQMHGAIVKDAYLPEEELYKYLCSADVVVVPRLTDLSSGIPGLAMTFGRLVIAPKHGAYPDYLAGTENLLYESGNPASLAFALEKATTLDRERIGAVNREISASWSWERIARMCIGAVGEAARVRTAKEPV